MPKKKHKVSQKVMLRAYEAAKSGKMSIREAAKIYKIPKSTLIDKVKGKSPLDSKKGPKPILTAEEEKALDDWGVRMAGIGFTSIKTQVLNTVKTILDKDEKIGRGREKRFGDNNLPGKDWWGRFCMNHSRLRRANEQALERAKRQVKSSAAVCKWKTGLKRIFQRCGVKDPSCIFTCTVNRFQVDGRGIVVGCHLKKKLKERSKYLTVLTAASANGKFVPPMMVYPRDIVEEMFEDEAVEGTFFTKSRNGDMNVELFYSWIGNHFVDYIPEGKNILLLIEGNWSYVDMYVSKLCKDKNIILYCMPPRSSYFQSPLTWGFSRQLPNEWKMESMNFELLNPGLKVDKYAFSAVFSNVWTHLASEAHIMTAFERSGVWPLESKGLTRSPAVTDHVNVSCFDEQGNEIEVGMYEEVTSDHLPAGMEVPYESGEVLLVSNPNVLQQFEKSQGLTAEQKEVFETRFLLNVEEPNDLLFSAWKALKELIAMNSNAEEFEEKSDTKSNSEDDDNDDDEKDEEEDDDDDDDSLLDWLSDESDDDMGDDKENVQEQIKDLQKKISDETAKLQTQTETECDGNHNDKEEGDEECENDNDDIPSQSASDSSKEVEEEEAEEKMNHIAPKVSSPRTAMSPLKITRYKHHEVGGRGRKQDTQQMPVKGRVGKRKARGRRR